MFSITEQFSAATKSQLEAQLNLLNNYASKAVESAQKVLALNISTTKASVEKSSAAARRLLEAKDPQEFFSAGKAPGFDNLLAYSRELFSIASAAQAELIQSAKAQIEQAAPAAKAVVAKPVAPAAKVKLAEVKKAAAAPVVAAAAAAAPADVAVAAPTAEPTPAPKAIAKPVAKAKPAAAAATPIADAIVQLVEPPEPAKPAAAPVVAAAAAPKPVVVKPAPKPVAAPKAAAKPPAVNFPTAKSVALKSVTSSAKTAPGKPQARQLDMLGGGKGKK